MKPLLASLRTFKDSGEIERIRKATDASIAAHIAALHAVKAGITEREISALMQYEWGKRGCERPAYAPIVGASFNSTVLHYSNDSGTLNAGDVLVIDAAGEYSMYASDITRTLPATGKFSDAKKAFSGVRKSGSRIVLTHVPNMADRASEYGAGLILAGHTHGGHVKIGSLTEKIAARFGNRYLAGFYGVKDALLYVNCGIGSSSVPIRAGAPAECAVFTLRAPKYR